MFCAINKTTVKLVLSKAVDTVTSENFTIEGANVTAATLDTDKKTVTLSVSGLDYKTNYSVAVTGILVDGTTSDFGSATFTTPSVTDLWELQITTLDASLVADGADNTEVTFKLISKVTGKVDEEADNVVLDLNTTYGTLASKRVTIQDGVATVLLSSEFSNSNTNAKIDAQIIEASGDYKDLIGEVVGTLNVPFIATTTENVQTLTLVSAEANQADRITLFFDKEVTLKHFVATNTKGELLYDVTGVSTGNVAKDLENLTDAQKLLIRHQLINNNNIKITQGANTNFIVKGLKPVANNNKALEVILEKTTVLKDNASVKIDVTTVNSLKKETDSSAEFKVTDARKPEATSVKTEGLNTLKIKFSEAIADSTFQIDGQFTGEEKSVASIPAAPANQAAANKAKAFTYEFGEFNPATLVDNRDLATVELSSHYWEAGDNKLSGYFGIGQHTIQVSSTEDFAAATDLNNMGTTQNLTFNIAANTGKPSATVTVESPEQFRVKFDKQLSLTNAAALKALFTSGDAELQFLDTDGEYRAVATRVDSNSVAYAQIVKDDFKFTQISKSEYLIELNDDWTNIYDTNVNNKNYYNDKYRIVIAKDKVTNIANGLKNDEIKLDLNYAGSPLNSPDTTSPVISKIDRVRTTDTFDVTMSEPVKLKDHVASNETIGQGQSTLAVTTVQFLGKDKNGVSVTVNGTVTGYADATTSKADKVLAVNWTNYVDGSGAQQTNTVTPQTVVDAGGSEDWTIVIRSISDDVGNTAASATKDFKVEKSPAGNTPFFIETYPALHAKAGKHMVEGKSSATSGIANKDTVEVIFSEGVQFTGTSDATNPANYTLNGVTLPIGTSISVADSASASYDTVEGLEKVTITLPKGTLNVGANTSNVMTVNKNLVSYDGSKIERDTEVIINMDENVALEAAEAAVSAYEALGGNLTTDALITAANTDADGLESAATALSPADSAALTQRVTDRKTLVGLVNTANGLVNTFEALDLNNDANIATAITAVTTAAYQSDINAVTDNTAKTALNNRVNAKKVEIKAAATVAEVVVGAATITGAGTSQETATMTVTYKNADGVALTTALAGDYAITAHAWEVTGVEQIATPTDSLAIADLTLSNDTTDTVTLTKASGKAVDVGGKYKVKATVTQGTLAIKSVTQDLTVN